MIRPPCKVTSLESLYCPQEEPGCACVQLHLTVAAPIQLASSHSCSRSVATRVLHKPLVWKRVNGRGIMCKMPLWGIRWPGTRSLSELWAKWMVLWPERGSFLIQINVRLLSLKYFPSLLMLKDHRQWKGVIRLVIRQKSNFLQVPVPPKVSLLLTPSFPQALISKKLVWLLVQKEELI